ncbi:MAG: GNAT family N-acetyltransferase [Clostridia bacterium]|nr:GNAT family N-acetyltransferase [Clostridia bacterium]
METIRRAVQGDTEIITALLVQVEHVHHLLRPDIFRGPEPHVKYSAEEITSMITDDEKPIFVFERDGKVSGYAFCALKNVSGDHVMNDIKYLYIDDLCVDEPERGAGIGRKLFLFVSEFAKEEGCTSVFLNVWHANEAAMRFYENLGMTPQRIIMEKTV